MLTLVPYLTDYKSAREAEKAWRDNKDFVIQSWGHDGDGKPTNRSNMIRLKALDAQIKLRYNKLQKVVIIDG